MKRVALLCLGLAFGAANAAEAQLTMQMSNGWSFTFAGNVNAFLIYENEDDGGQTVTPGGIVGNSATNDLPYPYRSASGVRGVRCEGQGRATRTSASTSASPRRSSAAGHNVN